MSRMKRGEVPPKIKKQSEEQIQKLKMQNDALASKLKEAASRAEDTVESAKHLEVCNWQRTSMSCFIT